MKSDTISLRSAQWQKSGPGKGDVLHVTEDGAMGFYGLADGQSGRRYGSQGGRASLEALDTAIRRRGLQALKQEPFPDELPWQLLREVRNALTALAGQEPLEEYASTLLALAVDPGTGDYLLIHLGDGCVLEVGQDTAVILSPPENGLTRQHTWLTTSRTAAAHFRVTFGNLGSRRRLMLMTDGVDCLHCGGSIPWRAAKRLAQEPAEAVLGYLDRQEYRDDASCILLDIGNKVPKAIQTVV